MSEMYDQMSLWGEMYETKKVKKDIRMIEFFAGIGSQYAAMKEVVKYSNPKINVESYKICEWAFNSYCAYNDIHIKDYTDYSNGLTKEELIQKVNGTSINYNEPLTTEQLSKKPIEWLRQAYNNIKATHNLINICNVKGDDLEIVDTDKYEYIVSWSFPCQDLSNAGLRRGLKDTTTRSGMCHEFLRIIEECKNKPQCLVMENVPDLVSSTFVKDFQLLEKKLTELGYTNYVEILNAKNYGIPQNRKRVFMVSLLGDYAYDFPCKIELKHKLKDMLEDEVDEKYYLSRKLINCFLSEGTGSYPRKERFIGNVAREHQDIGNSITTSAGSRPEDNFVVEEIKNKSLRETLENNVVQDGDFIDAYNRVIKKDVAGTITTRVDGANNTFIATKYKKYMEENNGEIPDLFDPYNEEKITDIAPTQTTQCGSTTSSSTILIKKDEKNVIDLKRGYSVEVGKEQENTDDIDVIGNYSKSGFNQTPIVGKNGVAPTITENHGQTAAILIKSNNKKGYEIAEEGDGVDISGRVEYHRGTVQKGMAQTINTKGTDGGVVVALYDHNSSQSRKSSIEDRINTNVEVSGTLLTNGYHNNSIVVEEKLKEKLCNNLIEENIVKEMDVINHSHTNSRLNGDRKVIEGNNIMTTLTTRGDCFGVVVKDEEVFTETEKKLFTEDGNIKRYIESDKVDEFKEGQMATTTFPNGYGHGPRTHDESIALNTIDRPVVKSNLRIRKLTPKECGRLMGFKDTDIDSIGLSDSGKFHVFGDSIVVSVLISIFSQLVFGDMKHIEIVENYVKEIKQ